MIKLIEKDSKIPFQAENNLFNSKIRCIYETYGFTPFTDYWEQNGGKAVISRLDNSFVIDVCFGADFSEIESFIKTVCSGNVLCSDKLTVKNLPYTSGYVMSLKNRRNTDTINRTESLFYTSDCDLKKASDLLNSCKSKDFTPPDYESLVLDIGHKLIKNTAVIQCAYELDRLVSFAVGNVNTQSAYISCVAVDKDYRRKKMGSDTVLKLINKLGGKSDIFLQRGENINKEFYNSLGFEDTGRWIEYSLL